MESYNSDQIGRSFQPDKLVVGFAISQIVLIVFLIVSISLLSRSDEINDEDSSRIPVATIGNFDSVAPEGYSGDIDGIERTLFELALRNAYNGNVLTSVEARVREDSVKTVYFGDKNVSYFSAIVDIPELEQSYWFYSVYSNEKRNQYVDYYKSYRLFCLDDSQEILYPNFECKDDFGIVGKYELVADFIEYFDFNYFSPTYTVAENSKTIKIYPHSFDINEETKQSYIQQTKDGVASLGVDSGLFEYYVIGPDDIYYYYSPK